MWMVENLRRYLSGMAVIVQLFPVCVPSGFAVFGRLTTTPINQYAFLGNTNYTMRCSSTLGSGSIHWFLIPVGNTVNLTIASGSEVNTEYSQMYLIDQPTVNDSNLIILSPNDSTAGTFMCSDVEMARGALLVVYREYCLWNRWQCLCWFVYSYASPYTLLWDRLWIIIIVFLRNSKTQHTASG